MAPLSQNTLQHFTHPQHQLLQIQAETEFLCHGCKTDGSGTKYRCCSGCDFDLHDYCAKCPTILSSFMHAHPLTLVLRLPQTSSKFDGLCNLCGEHAEALFYRCKDCDFNVHPLCTQLPRTLRHALHPAHPLTLLTSSPGHCAVCQGLCASWRYGCRECGFDVHFECVLAPTNVHCSERKIPKFGASPPSYWQPPPQPYGGYPYPYPYQYHMANHGHGHGGGGGSFGRFGKKMCALVGQLTLGVLADKLFGDVSFF